MAWFVLHAAPCGAQEGGTGWAKRVEPTDDWEQLELLCRWPEQLAYEEVRPLVLFGLPVEERAEQTGTSERTLYRRVARFGAEGMEFLFASGGAKRRALPPAIRRLVVDLKAEHQPMRPHEIATVCYVRSGRRPDYRTVDVRLHVEPALGGTRLKDLNPLQVQGLYARKLAEGLSPATVRKVHNVLHGALAQAVRWTLVHNNATDGAQAPNPRAEEIVPLTTEQARALLSAARGDRLEALYVLALTTGARKGELLALGWADLDLGRGLMRVRRGLTRSKGRFELGETKTKEGGEIELTSRAVSALKAHRRRQIEERLELDGLREDRGLVFASRRRTLINPSNLNRSSFAPLLRKAGLPEATRFHDLRHTCATLLLKERARPREVQSLLGHETIAMTMNTYGHLIPGMGKETADAMERPLLSAQPMSKGCQKRNDAAGPPSRVC